MKIKRLQKSSVRSGFTMVELSLTMAFVAVLLITISIVTTNIVTIYQKGLTLKAVNSVGRGLTDEFITGINTAPAVDTTSLCRSYLADENATKECIQNHAFKYVYQNRRDSDGRQLNGVFCTGTYSYLWNTRYGYQANDTVTIRYRTGSLPSDVHEVADISDGKIAPRLVRIKDPTYRLCTTAMRTDSYQANYPMRNPASDAPAVFDITEMHRTNASTPAVNNILSGEPEQGMLDAFDLDLELYELAIFPISQDTMTLRTYMSGTFVLATKRGNIDIVRSGDYCRPNQLVLDDDGSIKQYGDTSSLGNLGSEFNYCAINKFNFAARTAGVD